MAEGLMNLIEKARKPLIGGLVGIILFNPLLISKTYSSDVSNSTSTAKEQINQETENSNNYEQINKKDAEPQDEVDELSYAEKRKIYEENKLEVKIKQKKLKGYLNPMNLIDSIPIANIILTDKNQEDKATLWRVYHGEREITDAREFYQILAKMGTNTSFEINQKSRGIRNFKYFFSYEYPNRGLLSTSLPPYNSHEFTRTNSGIAVGEYNAELKRRLKLESSDLRKKLGLD